MGNVPVVNHVTASMAMEINLMIGHETSIAMQFIFQLFNIIEETGKSCISGRTSWSI